MSLRPPSKKNAPSPLIFHLGLLVSIVGATCFLLSFLGDPQLISESGSSSINPDVYECLTKRLPPPPKVVFMVIDAWRFDFLTSEVSPMSFLRQQISTGKAALFNAVVETPTVTMPRIKALVGGVNPSFLSLIANFFADEWIGDSWVRQGRKHDKKMKFYGDDTWLRLFPGTFDDHHGVTSFFVKDFTEVDNNVTTHMREQLNRKDWDLMILHYLGLDHIGHSLGGEAPEIPVKLAEMDGIAKEIVDTAAKDQPLVLFVVGDHGMTKSGSHGGGRLSETRVPVVIYNSGSTIRSIPSTPFDAQEIRQIDVANAVSHFLRLPLPKTSIGASIFPFLQRIWELDESEVDLDFVRHLQLWSHENNDRISFLIDRYLQNSSDSCLFTQTIGKEAITSFHGILRSLQDGMMKKSNNAWGTESLLGISLVATGCLMCLLYWVPYALSSGALHSPIEVFSVLLALLPFLTCSATSFVEQEHEIWYYTTSAVIFTAAVLRFSQKRSTSAKDLLVVLVLHRISFSVASGSRRRWRMSPELLPKAMFDDGIWQFEDFGRILDSLVTPKDPLPSALVLVAVVCYFCHQLTNSSINRRSKAIFVVLASCQTLKAVAAVSSASHVVDALSTTNLLLSLAASCFDRRALLFYLCNLVRPRYLLVISAAFEMGKRCQRAGLDGVLVLSLIGSSFFYMGNSNKISAIDIAVGYTGLSSYHPATVGLQIGMNMYAATAAFLLSFKSSTYGFSFLLRSLISQRVLICTGSLVALCIFSDHLFVWSVFAPKVLFEITHLVALLAVYLFYSGYTSISSM